MLIQDIKQPQPKKPVHIAGKVKKTTASVELIFHVNGKRYKGTQPNREVIDAFLHTGNTKFLEHLDDCYQGGVQHGKSGE